MGDTTLRLDTLIPPLTLSLFHSLRRLDKDRPAAAVGSRSRRLRLQTLAAPLLTPQPSPSPTQLSHAAILGNAATAVWWNAAIREWRAKKKGGLVYLRRGRRHAELLNDTAEAITGCAGLQSADALPQTHTCAPMHALRSL